MAPFGGLGSDQGGPLVGSNIEAAAAAGGRRLQSSRWVKGRRGLVDSRKDYVFVSTRDGSFVCSVAVMFDAI